MRTSYFAGIGLLLLLGCGTEATPGPGTTGTQDTSPSAKGGSTTKASSSTKSTKTGQGGSAAKTSEGEGGADSEGGAASDGGADSTTKTSSKATGGTKSSSASSSKATGGKSSSSGSVKTSSTGGAGGKSSGTGGKSSTAAGGTSTVATTGAGNTGGAATFKCDNLQAVAGQAGQAKPSGAAGGLKVLDWAGFKSAISYTFDDSSPSQISNYKAMNDAGGKYTFYLWTEKAQSSDAVWGTALKDGHELANHSQNHTGDQSAVQGAQTFLKDKWGVVGYSFAAPNGTAVSSGVTNMFLSVRSVAGGSMSPGDTGALAWLPSDVASTSNWSPAAGKWKVICIHGFDGDGYQANYSASQFTTTVKSALSAGSWVTTVTNVAAYQVGQSLMKAGGSSIKWTKPAIFPPNMCVRATTTGGTVKQKGAEVPWNDHGYYEISLDAGEVTVE